MNVDDFNCWLEDFSARFPNVRRHNLSTPEAVSSWFDVLEGADLQAAMSATYRMQKGTLEPPADWSMIPATILRESKQIELERIDSRPAEPAERCGRCDGSGVVVRSDHKARRVAYRCACEAGERWHNVEAPRGSAWRGRSLPLLRE